MVKIIVGVMGPGSNALKKDLNNAYEIGKFIASKNWVTLTGGRNEGVMNEALKGAKENNGLTLGILPSDDKITFSPYLDIPVCTNMRSGRNYLNVLSSNIIVVCGIDHGTSSEISLAIKPNKKIILIGLYEEANKYFEKLAPNLIYVVEDYLEAIEILKKELN
ncbi:MAG: cytochrome [Nanoarchaeota archaeon]|nr:cytochrome [Nanoarchaeota archaeon]